MKMSAGRIVDSTLCANEHDADRNDNEGDETEEFRGRSAWSVSFVTVVVVSMVDDRLAAAVR